MVKIYPERKPFDSGFFDTGGGHSLYYARYGQPRGRPVVYLHGGPGGGCSFQEYRLFNPDHFNILIFDQRGAGKSRPYAGVANNGVTFLIEDIERLRRKFSHEKWSVAGGSWGSALAMLYADRYPEHVERMLLRGVFFADRAGARHIAEETGIAETMSNDFFTAYRDFIPRTERQHGLVQAYYSRLISGDQAMEEKAATLFTLWDISIARFRIDHEWLNEAGRDPQGNIALSRLFFHFALHEFDDGNRRRLIARMSDLGIPIDIIHGRQDYICPVANAQDLHDQCRNSRLHIAGDCGHSQKEPPLMQAFIDVTDRWADEDQGTQLPVFIPVGS